MKKLIIILCIIIGVGLTIGIVGVIVSAVNGGSNMKEVKKTETYSAGENLKIKTYTDDIKVSVGDGEEIKFVYYESNKHKVEIKRENGGISFEVRRKFTFFSFDWFNKDKRNVSVILPKSFNGSLDIDVSTGFIEADLSGVTVDNFSSNATTGDTKITNVTTVGNAEFHCSTGRITASTINAGGTLDIKCTTGGVTFENVIANDKLTAEGTTGSVKLLNVKAKETVVKETTGDATLNVDCNDLNVKSSTGKINFTVKNADKITVKCTTGDVKGLIYGDITEFDIYRDTTTGGCNLPIQTVGKGKSLKVETTTGDINVKFEKV